MNLLEEHPATIFMSKITSALNMRAASEGLRLIFKKICPNVVNSDTRDDKGVTSA
jgi:hypothetical protein